LRWLSSIHLREPLLAWVKTEFGRRFGASSTDETVSRQEIAVMKREAITAGIASWRCHHPERAGGDPRKMLVLNLATGQLREELPDIVRPSLGIGDAGGMRNIEPGATMQAG
jgi:hypothetical protein